MIRVFWSENSFNYLDTLDNETKVQIIDQFNDLISFLPRRFPKKQIDSQNIRICMLPRLPFVIIFILDEPREKCVVLRVFHDRQEKKL